MSTLFLVNLFVFFTLFVGCAPKKVGDHRNRVGAPGRIPQGDVRTDDRESEGANNGKGADEPLASSPDGSMAIRDVYLAQTHVLAVDSQYLRLVSDREALLKVNLTALDPDIKSPSVSVIGKIGKVEETLSLVGPEILSLIHI